MFRTLSDGKGLDVLDLHYCKIATGNFGDDMNAWFWDDVFPNYRDLYPGTTMFGIGSLLWRANMEAFDKILVMGSGTGVGVIPKKIPESIRFAWVRGPMTAREMGLGEEFAITDGAVLTPRLDRFSDIDKTSGGTIFVPHCGTERLPLDWGRIADRADVELVSPSSDAEAVIRRIAEAELVIAESMHAAIIADAFRVPWVPIAFSPEFSYFKWNDWGRSVEVEFDVQNGLQRYKAALKFLPKIKRALLRKQSPLNANNDPRSAIRAPNLDMPESDTDGSLRFVGKDRIKKIASVAAPLLEASVAADLRRARNARSYLSAEQTIHDRQSQLMERIEQVSRGTFPQ